WLHTFTVGAPLSFLDHHLRAGDALYGERVDKVLDELRAFGALFQKNELARIAVATASMNQIADLTDVDIAEVHQSRHLFEQIDAELAPLRKLLDFWQALRWLPANDPVRQRGWADLASGHFGDVIDVIDAGSVDTGDSASDEAEAIRELLRQTRERVEQEGFLSWAIAFPTVWRHLESGQAQGGFDAIIGNPPWDRMKLQQVEWFAARKREIAFAQKAADRKRMIDELERNNDPLSGDFKKANERAEAATYMARSGGDYPLLSGGDVNIYSLFVERAMSLVKRGGMVGLLTPSGIASDKTSSTFFKGVSTQGRLKALYDFENRRTRYNAAPFFPDVDSRFKFCVFVASPSRTAKAAMCAFFLQSVAELNDPEQRFALSAEDFSRVNPNTGTAPIFRSRRDAELTTAIYSSGKILSDRSGDDEIKAWPLKYSTMFHMTNDSGLFRTRRELEEQEGGWHKGANRYGSPKGDWVPLYEGKMIQAFDHRAASVVVNPENQHRPAQPEPATLEQHRDPSWLPAPQFWVLEEKCKWSDGPGWVLGFKEITAPTNVRTFIAALLPTVAFGNKVPLLLREGQTSEEWLLAANLNSIPFDYVTRQKVQGQTLNLFIVEQLPVILPGRFHETKFGSSSAAELLREIVLELTYTAQDMAPFARDMGYTDDAGNVLPPFEWDEERRLRLRAKLDAIFFHLYGITDRNDVRYIYSTFPIVERQEREIYGEYRSCDLCLAYLSALVAGSTETDMVA
ncbi:MAG: restriction endonuclease, partial [Candidatus Accumulibacter sp.]|nr:restriction endonuclease [Accumulibacter sp.]